MKKFLIFLLVIVFCNDVYAHTYDVAQLKEAQEKMMSFYPAFYDLYADGIPLDVEEFFKESKDYRFSGVLFNELCELEDDNLFLAIILHEKALFLTEYATLGLYYTNKKSYWFNAKQRKIVHLDDHDKVHEIPLGKGMQYTNELKEEFLDALYKLSWSEVYDLSKSQVGNGRYIAAGLGLVTGATALVGIPNYVRNVKLKTAVDLYKQALDMIHLKNKITGPLVSCLLQFSSLIALVNDLKPLIKADDKKGIKVLVDRIDIIVAALQEAMKHIALITKFGLFVAYNPITNLFVDADRSWFNVFTLGYKDSNLNRLQAFVNDFITTMINNKKDVGVGIARLQTALDSLKNVKKA